jgi:N utilization substance protein B
VQKSVDELAALSWIDNEPSPDIRAFAVALIRNSVENIEYIDNLIKKHSKNWSFERLTAVDKSILRLSIYSMMFLPDIPTIVTINEAIELGKIYGGDSSGQFINGILDAIKNAELKEDVKTGGSIAKK